jgi:beta-lactamase superfamily II metal-dependent hydrolase
MIRTLFLFLASIALATAATAPLQIFFVDVEGGQMTLIVTPAKETILVDGAWPGFGGRDVARLGVIMDSLGFKSIDYLVMTHYHLDHVGGVPAVVAKFPVQTFIDHGANTETGAQAQRFQQDYIKAVGASKRMTVKPGDTLPIKDVRIDIVSARGVMTDKPLKGAGQSNPLCAGAQKANKKPDENEMSVGFILTYGKFRFADFGDITRNNELELACPSNKIGKVSLYLITHHGSELSNAKELVHAMAPRVAISNNGVKKGGSPQAMQTILSSPGLADLWQLHTAAAGDPKSNTKDDFIANPGTAADPGHYFAVRVEKSGTFTIHNTRNNLEKTYKP